MIKLIVIVYLSTETALKVARYVEISCGVKRSAKHVLPASLPVNHSTKMKADVSHTYGYCN